VPKDIGLPSARPMSILLSSFTAFRSSFAKLANFIQDFKKFQLEKEKNAGISNEWPPML
jgi:hypothetical protein